MIHWFSSNWSSSTSGSSWASVNDCQHLQASDNADLVLLQLFQRALHICNRIVLAEIAQTRQKPHHKLKASNSRTAVTIGVDNHPREHIASGTLLSALVTVFLRKTSSGIWRIQRQSSQPACPLRIPPSTTTVLISQVLDYSLYRLRHVGKPFGKVLIRYDSA